MTPFCRIRCAGECHKCRGVEYLIINAVSRSSGEQAFCADGGSVLISDTWTFTRKPISFPCSSNAATMEETAKQSAKRRRRRRTAHWGSRWLVKGTNCDAPNSPYQLLYFLWSPANDADDRVSGVTSMRSSIIPSSATNFQIGSIALCPIDLRKLVNAKTLHERWPCDLHLLDFSQLI